MSIKIHYGDNGGYKTAGAIADDAVPAIKENRDIVTNVRGFNLERIKSAYPDYSGTVYNLDLDSDEGLGFCRTWFHWAPKGAFIIFDEVQLIFPTEWTTRDWAQIVYPGGRQQAKSDDRPFTAFDAFTRHRHWNWDIVLTTPSLTFIHSKIRGTCQAAYSHVDLKLLGKTLSFILGDYKETMHHASLNRAPSKAITRFRRIDKSVFKLYQSTATGSVTETRAGTSIFKSPTVLALLALLAVIAFRLFTSGGVQIFNDSHPQPPAPSSAPPAPSRAPSSSGPPSPGVAVAGSSRALSPVVQFVDSHDIYVTGFAQLGTDNLVFLGFHARSSSAQPYLVTSNELGRLGLSIQRMADCVYLLRAPVDRWERVIGCRPPDQQQIASATPPPPPQ